MEQQGKHQVLVEGNGEHFLVGLRQFQISVHKILVNSSFCCSLINFLEEILRADALTHDASFGDKRKVET